MPKVFISYRRVDVMERTHRIADWLTIKYGEENVFLDVDVIRSGQDFKLVLEESLDQSDVVLIIVGDRWVDELIRREEDRQRGADYVYVEIMRALDNATPIIIPIMINNTPNIKRDDLPPEMHQITTLNYARVRDNPDFHKDMDEIRLIIDEKFPPPPEAKTLDNALRARLYGIGGFAGAVIVVMLFVLFGTFRNLTGLPPAEATLVARETADAIETEIDGLQRLTADAAVAQGVIDVESRETQTQVFLSTQIALTPTLSEADAAATQASINVTGTTVAETAAVIRGTITQSAILTATDAAREQQTQAVQAVIDQNTTATAIAALTVTAQSIVSDNASNSTATRAAINQLATQNIQLTDNAPTNTPEPSPSPTPSDTPIPSPTPLPPAGVRVGQVNVGLGSTLYVRRSPSIDAQPATVISPGDLAIILSENLEDNWLEVELLQNGVTGWVAGEFVNVIGEFPQSRLNAVTEAYTRVTSSADHTPLIEEFDGVPMVLAPVGCFNFGITAFEIDIVRNLNLDDSATLDELPDSTICLNRPFWIDRYEVSQAQFIAFGGETDGTPEFVGADLPQTNVSWAEAKAFCELRGGYLPTEVQWEYAARGVDRLLFPWGNEFQANAYNWNRTTDVDEIEPVTDYPDGASWIGAYQMQGNVSEWTLSAYFAYPLPTISRIYLSDFGTDDLDSDTRPIPVARGSSYLDGIEGNARNTNRIPASYNERPGYFGIRCVRDWE